MAKQRERQLALQYRKKGKSIGDMSRELGVSKSTVSGWCKDIQLSPAQIKKIAANSKHHATAALLTAAEKQRAERQQNISKMRIEGASLTGHLSDRNSGLPTVIHV
jgi:transposase